MRNPKYFSSVQNGRIYLIVALRSNVKEKNIWKVCRFPTYFTISYVLTHENSCSLAENKSMALAGSRPGNVSYAMVCRFDTSPQSFDTFRRSLISPRWVPGMVVSTLNFLSVSVTVTYSASSLSMA